MNFGDAFRFDDDGDLSINSGSIGEGLTSFPMSGKRCSGGRGVLAELDLLVVAADVRFFVGVVGSESSISSPLMEPSDAFLRRERGFFERDKGLFDVGVVAGSALPEASFKACSIARRAAEAIRLLGLLLGLGGVGAEMGFANFFREALLAVSAVSSANSSQSRSSSTGKEHPATAKRSAPSFPSMPAWPATYTRSTF